MLVFPQWRPELPEAGCRGQRWLDAERFAPYLARPFVLPPLPPQYEDEDSLGGSSPEHVTDGGLENKDGMCEWRGCGARFPTVARLSAHVARAHAHAHSDGLFYCGWKSCSRPQRGFNARYKMLVHVRTHTNERPHTCNQCSKSFSRAENLKIHLRSHSGEKPYICPYEGCGKAYSNSSDRFKHTRTHTVDKPYCCKVPGCNKRYTDPSSLRKHVKTYKHFTSDKEIPRRESEDDKVVDRLSPQREMTYIEHSSPLRAGMYSPPESAPSPRISPYDSIVPLSDAPLSPPYSFVPAMDRVSYVRPLEPVYPIRVPTNEISYMEYSQMYDHAYKNYYLNSISYPVLGPSIREKIYTYEDQTHYDDVTMENVVQSPKRLTEDMPLNLICSKRMECKPIEELVKITDLPLDLSTKS